MQLYVPSAKSEQTRDASSCWLFLGAIKKGGVLFRSFSLRWVIPHPMLCNISAPAVSLLIHEVSSGYAFCSPFACLSTLSSKFKCFHTFCLTLPLFSAKIACFKLFFRAFWEIFHWNPCSKCAKRSISVASTTMSAKPDPRTSERYIFHCCCSKFLKISIRWPSSSWFIFFWNRKSMRSVSLSTLFGEYNFSCVTISFCIQTLLSGHNPLRFLRGLPHSNGMGACADEENMGGGE